MNINVILTLIIITKCMKANLGHWQLYSEGSLCQPYVYSANITGGLQLKPLLKYIKQKVIFKHFKNTIMKQYTKNYKGVCIHKYFFLKLFSPSSSVLQRVKSMDDFITNYTINLIIWKQLEMEAKLNWKNICFL